MTFGPVTKNLARERKQRKKKLTMTSCQEILVAILFFLLMANLEQTGNRIPDP